MSCHGTFLLAHTEKFQCLTINLRNIGPDKKTETLQIKDQIITNTSQIKLLGAEIDDKHNFTSHISNICIKASQKVGVLMRLRNLIPWWSKIDNLQIIHRTAEKYSGFRQERAIRALFNSYSETSENLLVRAKLPSLLNRKLQVIASNVQSKIWPRTKYCWRTV